MQIIGITWQFMFLAKRLLADAGYIAGARLLVNLVGTKDTMLDDFSQEVGEGNTRWRKSPDIDFSRELDPHNNKCLDPNLQLEYQLALHNLNEPESHKIIRDIGRQLGLAYNHNSSPRCFNYNTEIFPWQQYFNGWR